MDSTSGFDEQSRDELERLDRFCVLEPPDPDDLSWVWAGFSKPFLAEQPADWYNLAFEGNAPIPDGPVELVVYLGKKLPALLGFDGNMIMCSADLVRCLEKNGASFPLNHPAVLLDRDGENMVSADFRWVRPVCGGGRKHLTRGMRALGKDAWKNDPFSVRAYGIFFDTETWTGAPVFHLERSDYEILVTYDVGQCVRLCNFPGLRVTKLSEVGKHYYESEIARIKRNKSERDH